MLVGLSSFLEALGDLKKKKRQKRLPFLVSNGHPYSLAQSHLPPSLKLAICISLAIPHKSPQKGFSALKFFFNLFYLAVWVFIAAPGPPLLAASRATFWLRCLGFSAWRLLLLGVRALELSGFGSCGMWA